MMFMAGANSIFTGDRLLTTSNPEFDADKVGQRCFTHECAGFKNCYNDTNVPHFDMQYFVTPSTLMTQTFL